MGDPPLPDGGALWSRLQVRATDRRPQEDAGVRHRRVRRIHRTDTLPRYTALPHRNSLRGAVPRSTNSSFATTPSRTATGLLSDMHRTALQRGVRVGAERLKPIGVVQVGGGRSGMCASPRGAFGRLGCSPISWPTTGCTRRRARAGSSLGADDRVCPCRRGCCRPACGGEGIELVVFLPHQTRTFGPVAAVRGL